jgi:hypothetical protein
VEKEFSDEAGVAKVKESGEGNEEEEDGIFEVMKREFEMTKDISLGIIPRDRLIQATEQLRMARMNGTYQARVSALTWAERGSNSDAVGPSNGNGRLGSSVTSGRMRAILVDKFDATHHTVWVGGVDGGLWKTTDISASPATWTLVNDFFGNLAISSICQHPSNPNIMYFSTGERSPNVDAVQGGGVWKSTDAGVTWNLLPSTTIYANISRIVCDASGNVYIGSIASLATGLGTSGLYRSIDGGTTWTNISPSGLSTRISELEISSTGRMHVTCGYYNTAAGSAGYRFTDIPATVASGTWTSPTVSFSPVQYNVDLAVAGTTLYALPASSVFQTPQVWKSTDGGDNWAITTTTPTIGGTTPVSSGQAWYNMAIGVDPTDPNKVMVAGLNSYITTNGGTTWSANSVWVTGVPGSANYIHADHHIIVWDDDQVLDGGDGGLFYSANDGVAFADRNVGLRLKQFYAVAAHPSTTNYFLAGAQDNGVHQFNNAGLSSSVEVTGGDGAFVHIDQDEPSFQWGSYVYNNFRRSTNSGANWSSVNLADLGQFINPSDYDDMGNKMYSGYTAGNYLRWDNPQSGSAFAIVPVAAFNSSSVVHVQVSPNTANRVYFGTAGGRIVQVDNAHAPIPTATNITGSGMSASNVSCVAMGTTDNNLLATFSNYGAIHVWVSTVGGGAAGWTNITGTGLPDIPVRWAMFYPEDNTKAILATEMGIYETNLINGASTVWVQNSTFPVVRTDMLQYRPADGVVAAATHGRGLWTSSVPFTIPYVRYAFNYNTQPETTVTTSGCSNYRDYVVNMRIDQAPVGNANITLSVAGGSTATQGIDYDFTTNGSFVSPSTSLSFASGTTTPQPVTIRIYNDAEIESSEFFTLNYSIGGGTNAVAAPSSSSYTFTIVENDAVPASNTYAVGVNDLANAVQTPFRSNLQKFRIQAIYTAAELKAAGAQRAGSLTSMTMRVITKNSTQPYAGFTISLANTTATNLSTGFINPGFTQVYSNNYSTVVGDNTFAFTTPFSWDGVSNVLVNICFDNAPNPADAAADITESTSSPFGAGVRATTYSSSVAGAGCSLAAAFIADSRATATFGFINPIETVLSSNRTETISNNGNYYFYTSSGTVLSRITGASANLGCVATNIFEAGNTWQTFLAGQRSQKVFDVAPTTNPGASYTIGIYFTAAELAGKPPASVKIAKTTAATMAAATSGNTQTVTTTFTAYGTGYLFSGTFTGFSKFFLIDAGVVLPVDLVSFSGQLNAQYHSALQWQTTNQYNLSNFEVQRSYDGIQFATAGIVNAIQNPASIQGYTFTDPLVAKAVNFYRLKMVDNDGRFKYSAIVRINSNKPVKFVELLQNPVKDNISFLLSNPEKAKVSAQLFSNSGQLIRKWDLGTIEGNVVLPFNNTVIASGIYTLRVAAGSKQENIRISKQ